MAYSKHSKDNNFNCFVDRKASKCRTCFVKLVSEESHTSLIILFLWVFWQEEDSNRSIFAKIIMLQIV